MSSDPHGIYKTKAQKLDLAPIKQDMRELLRQLEALIGASISLKDGLDLIIQSYKEAVYLSELT